MDPNRAELLDKIKAQGDVVRKLKEQKAEKVMVRLVKLFLLSFQDHKCAFTTNRIFQIWQQI